MYVEISKGAMGVMYAGAGIEPRSSDCSFVPRLVNFLADPRCAEREWPVPLPRCSVDDHALAAIFVLRARAARKSNGRVGLYWSLRREEHEHPVRDAVTFAAPRVQHARAIQAGQTTRK